MANRDAPNGFLPINNIGADNCGRLLLCRVVSATSAIGKGDPVILAGSADAAGNPTVDIAGVTGAVAGVVQAIDVDYEDGPTSPEAGPIAASGAGYVLVNIDPDQLYEVQVTGTIAATNIGSNANFVYAAPNTANGISNSELSSTFGTTATSQFRVVGLTQRADNEFGTNAKVIVKINNHQFSAGTGSAGV